MKNLLIILICLGLVGCAVLSRQQIRYENRKNLLKLSVGMTKEEVFNVMGVGQPNPLDVTVMVHNPYKSETLRAGDKIFEVIYYYTDLKKDEGIITDDELTPLIFDEGKLIGWGWRFLEDTTKKYELTIKER